MRFGLQIETYGEEDSFGRMLAVARLTEEDTARRVQRFLGYDPHPPYGGIDYDHLGAWASTVRAGVSLAAPMITAKPKRLTRQNR